MNSLGKPVPEFIGVGDTWGGVQHLMDYKLNLSTYLRTKQKLKSRLRDKLYWELLEKIKRFKE